MKKKISRREFASLAGLGAAALITPAIAKKQTPDEKVSALEKKLAAPFSDAAKKIAKDSIANVEKAANDRLKFKLPENSEPCTMFIAQPSEKKSQ